MTKQLSDYEWVKLAASKDNKGLREGYVLCGVATYQSGHHVATDHHHRMHWTGDIEGDSTPIVRTDMPNGEAAAGTFPNVQQVILVTRGHVPFEVSVTAELRDVLKALAGLNRKHQGYYLVQVGPAVFKPEYLSDALAGTEDGTVAQVYVTDPLKPMLITVRTDAATWRERHALIMPISEVRHGPVTGLLPRFTLPGTEHRTSTLVEDAA